MAGWKKELSAGRPGRQDCSDYLMTNLIPRMRHDEGHAVCMAVWN